MNISSNDTSTTENLIPPSPNPRDNDAVQATAPLPPEPKELGEQKSEEVATVLDGSRLVESKRHEFEAESSITSADFEPSPTEAELVFGSLRLTKSDHSPPESEDLGSPFSDTISTKSCVVLPLEEEDSDLSIETHVAMPENGVTDDSSRTEDVDVSQSAVLEFEQGNPESALSHSIPETQTGPPEPDEILIPEEVQNLKISSAESDPEPTEPCALPTVPLLVSVPELIPQDTSTIEELAREPESKSDCRKRVVSLLEFICGEPRLSRSEPSGEGAHSNSSLLSDNPPATTGGEAGSKDIGSTVAAPPLSASAKQISFAQSVAHPEPDSDVLPPIGPPASIPEPAVNLKGVVVAAEIAPEALDTLLIGNDLNDPPSIPAIENDHVLELEKEEAPSDAPSCIVSFQTNVVDLDPPSVPLPKSLDSSFAKKIESDGGEDLVSEDSTKSVKEMQEVETDENHENPQDAQKPIDLKMKSKAIEESSDESDEETLIKPAFDIKMKYKAIDQDNLSPIHPVFDRDSTYEIVFIQPNPGSAEALRQRVKKPFVLRLFKGKELDEQVIHSDQDISDTMRRICEERIDEFEIEELMTTELLPTPKSAEFPRGEEGKMYKTKTMDLFTLLDELRRKSEKFSSERDEDTLDQETLAALIADDFAREKARMEVSENDESPISNDKVEVTFSTTSNTENASSSPSDAPVVNRIEALTRELLLPLSDEQQDQLQIPLNNSQVELPALIGNPPDQAQIQRLLRFMRTLKELVSGLSSVQEPKPK